MLSVAQYRQSIIDAVAPMPITDVPIDDALGLVLAADIAAPMSSPAFANSAMDGYAVRSADLGELPAVLEVAADIPAGAAGDRELIAGTAHRIMTGAPIPAGADAVVRVEWTDGGTSRVRIDRSVDPGEAIRCEGEDFSAGSPLLAAGTVIGPGLIGLAASVGLQSLPVRRRPRVAVAATGDELVAGGGILGQGQIFDSNSHLMAALLRNLGLEPTAVATLSDSVGDAVSWLRATAKDCDLVITMGGVSAGAYEVVKDVFTQVGQMEFVHVAVQPGKPQGRGHLDSTPVIALPGNPVSSAVSFELFVVPALRKMLGYPNPERSLVTVRSAVSVRRSVDRTRYLPAWVDLAANEVATPGVHGSHRLTTLRDTNCLIEVEPGTSSIEQGDLVRVLLTS